MSAARTLTATEGVDRDTGSVYGAQFDDEETVSILDGKPRWRRLSFDAFATPGRQSEILSQAVPAPHTAAYNVSTAKRAAQVAFAIFACWLASGIVCGFAALKPVLVKQRIYADLCPSDYESDPASYGDDGDLIPCAEQDMRLNLLFIVANITANVTTAVVGATLDRYGRRVCYFISSAVLSTASALLACAFSGMLPAAAMKVDVYLLGHVLLGLGGTFVFVPSYQISNAFPRHSELIMALITGAFDASAAVFLFYRIAYEATAGALTPGRFFGAYLVVPALMLMAELTLMPPHAYDSRPELDARIEQAEDDYAADHSRLNRERLDSIEGVAGDVGERAAQEDTEKKRQEASGVWGVLHGARLSAQMRSPWYVLLLLLTVLQMLRMNYFIATVRSQYRYMLGSDGAAEKINRFFDVALPIAGVASTPFIGMLLNTFSVVSLLILLTGLIVVLGLLNCLPFMWASYATVVAFVLFRPLFYSALSDFAAKVFGFATFGRIYGTILCISGLANFVQPGLDALTHGVLHGNPVPINTFMACAGAATSTALTMYASASMASYQEAQVTESLQTESRPPMTPISEEPNTYGTMD